MLSELYKQGAMTKDYAILNWGDTNKEFYSGKAGIFIGTPRGMSQDYMNGRWRYIPKPSLYTWSRSRTHTETRD